MSFRRPPSLVLAASLVLLPFVGACRLFGSDTRPVDLTITAIAAPDTVAVGATFRADFTVQSGGCVRFRGLRRGATAGRTVGVGAHGTDASSRNTACTADIRYDVAPLGIVAPTTAGPFTILALRPTQLGQDGPVVSRMVVAR